MTPLTTRVFQIIMGVLSIPIFGTAIIGTSYNSPFLEHIEDTIIGNTTTPVVSLNAPNWGFGIPIPAPAVTSIASSSNANAASGLASSTTYYFAIAALDGTGTTSQVAGITTASFKTDASTTQPKPEVINIGWTPQNGATGYAIYFSTTTPTYNQYFLATTSSAFTFSTSTGSLAGSYTKLTTTAYSELLSPVGPDVFNDNVLSNGTSTASASTTGMQINGTADIITNGTTTACEFDTVGSIFYNLANSHEWGCGSSGWTKIF